MHKDLLEAHTGPCQCSLGISTAKNQTGTTVGKLLQVKPSYQYPFCLKQTEISDFRSRNKYVTQNSASLKCIYFLPDVKDLGLL